MASQSRKSASTLAPVDGLSNAYSSRSWVWDLAPTYEICNLTGYAAICCRAIKNRSRLGKLPPNTAFGTGAGFLRTTSCSLVNYPHRPEPVTQRERHPLSRAVAACARGKQSKAGSTNSWSSKPPGISRRAVFALLVSPDAPSQQLWLL